MFLPRARAGARQSKYFLGFWGRSISCFLVFYLKFNGHAEKWFLSLCVGGALRAPLRFPSALFNKITVAFFRIWRGSFYRKACKDRASTPSVLSAHKHQNLFLSFGPGMKRVSGYKPPLAARPSPIYFPFKKLK